MSEKRSSKVMGAQLRDRVRGCAVGAAVGDALGMPLEFGPRRSIDHLVWDMAPGRLPAGTFTDDTEMALALAESLLHRYPLDPTDLAQRFVAWFRTAPPDVGIHTHSVLSRIAAGEPWQRAAEEEQRQRPAASGNGSVMRCWPVALAHWNNLDRILGDSRLQSRVTHPHPDCQAGSALVNSIIYYLLRGTPPADSIAQAIKTAHLPPALQSVVEAAPTRRRRDLVNSGWVHHTLESAIWGLLTTDSFETALVQVVNLGNDADTAGAVTGALAGATYGLKGIPDQWLQALQGEWPLPNGKYWQAKDLIELADRLVDLEAKS